MASGEERRVHHLDAPLQPTARTHPDPEGACFALARHPRALKPVPKKVGCTQIWDGPQVALVRGTFRGKRIRAWFKRTDGCEIGRWNALSALLSRDS